MKKLLILFLICLLLPLGGYAITYGLTGKDTNFTGDVNVPSGSNYYINEVAVKLSDFAATTSAELAGVISDETGTDKLVYNTSPTLVTPILGSASATQIVAGIVDSNSGIYITSSIGDAHHNWKITAQDTASGAFEIKRSSSVGDVDWLYPYMLIKYSGLYLNVVTGVDVHLLLSENEVTKWDIYNDNADDNLQVKSGATLRYEFGTDGTAVADVAWNTFSPVITATGRDLLVVALEDANKPVKPYEGIPTVTTDYQLKTFEFLMNEKRDELFKEWMEIIPERRERQSNEFKTLGEKQVEYERYAKSPAKIAIASAKYLEYLTEIIDTMQLKIGELETRVEVLEKGQGIE